MVIGTVMAIRRRVRRPLSCSLMAATLNLRTVLALLVIAVLMVVSFFRFSAYHYPFLDSDMAIHVLMARGFEFYHNLYYWGQTRLGSLMPLLAFFPWKVGLNPLNAVSAVQFGMAITVVIGFFFLERKVLITVVFASLFLFPIPALVYTLMPGHPALPHIALTVLGVLAAMRAGVGGLKVDVFWFAVTWLIALVAVWVSDLAMVTAPVVWIWMLYRVSLCATKSALVRMSGIVLLLVLSLPMWVTSLKSGRVDYSGYDGQAIAAVPMALQGLLAHTGSMFRAMSFTDGFKWSGLFHWSMFLGTALGLFLIIKAIRDNGFQSMLQRPSMLWCALAVTSYTATLMSGWAALNGYDSRYLAVPVVFLMMSLCSMARAKGRVESLLGVVLLVAATASGLSFSEKMPHNERFQLDDEARVRLRSLRSATILGDYWFCYAMAAYNADEVIPIAFTQDFLRNGHQVEMAFLSDSIFVCTSPKYPGLPDTLRQHGWVLTRTTESDFVVGNSTLARYTLHP